MAEFCLDCWNKINESNDTPDLYIMSRQPEFCEECNQWKPVIIAAKRTYFLRKIIRNLREKSKENT